MARAGKREQIMQAAEKLFTRRRFHEITLDDIVQEAHVGKGTVYKYFKDKDDLFFQVATSGFDEMCDLLRREVPGEAPFAQQLLRVCVSVTDFFDRRRQLFRMIQAEEARMASCRGNMREQWTAKRHALAVVLSDILRKGVAEGVVRSDVSPELLAAFLMSMLRTRARDTGTEATERPDHQLVVELFLHGASRREPVVVSGGE